MSKSSLEETVKILKDMKVTIPLPQAAITQKKRNSAIDMAIEALNCSEMPNNSDCISRQAAIDAFEDTTYTKNEIRRRITELPSAQPEPSTEIQEILDYLDNTLHPIVSPDNWNVYAELHDMVSRLPSAQPEAKTNANGDWVILNKDKILKAGMEGREVDFRIGGRLFAIREKAQ